MLVYYLFFARKKKKLLEIIGKIKVICRGLILISPLGNSNDLTELYLNNLKVNKDAANCLKGLIYNCPLKTLSIANIECSVRDFKIVI